MGKLIELEWRKNRIGNWVRWAALLGAALGLLIFAMAFLGIANDPETGVPDAAPGHGGISSPIELLTSMCFLVFTGVMLSVFIVGAYQNGTMSLVFSYPVRRQKLLAAQMLAVWIFCFGALAAAKLLLYGCVLAGRFSPSAFPLDFDMTRGAFYGQLLLRSAVTVTEGFIALFAGLALHSARAAIVTSFLLVLLTQGNIGSFTMADSAVFPAVLTGISLLCALLSLRGAETQGPDVRKVEGPGAAADQNRRGGAAHSCGRLLLCTYGEKMGLAAVRLSSRPWPGPGPGWCRRPPPWT